MSRRHPYTKAARIRTSKEFKQGNTDFFGTEVPVGHRPNPKNLVMCTSSHKEKLQFESKEKADRFIMFNADSIAMASGYAPTRSYWCQSCGCWHVTSKPMRTRGNSITH